METTRSLRALAVVAFALMSLPSVGGSNIYYFGTMEEATAACVSDAIPWNTDCNPRIPSFTSWCSTYIQNNPSPNLASYTRILFQSQPVAPYHNCLNISTSYTAYAWPKTACPTGTGLVGPSGYDCLSLNVIQQSTESQKQLGMGVRETGACSHYGNPCDASTGNKLQMETDFVGGDGIPSFVRTYNSLDFTNSANIGVGWMHNHVRILVFGSGTITVVRGDGQREIYTKSESGAWIGQADTRRRIIQTQQGYRIEYPSGSAEFYSPDGRLSTDTDQFGRVTSYTYSLGDLSSVTGPYGHKITFAAIGSSYKVMFPSGHYVNYIIDTDFNLATAQYHSASTGYVASRTYKYENSGLRHALTGIVNELGNRVSTYTYNAATGKATRTEQTAGVRLFDFSYGGYQTTVTDAAGNAETLSFQRNLGVNNLASRVNAADGKTLTQSFDASNNLVSSTDEEGRTTTYTWDSQNRPTQITHAVGTPEEQTTSYGYASATLALPVLIEVPSVSHGLTKRTDIAYDSQNRPANITVSGYAPTGASVSRSITLAYTPNGQIASVTGTAGDVLQMSYWNCTTGGACGQLQSITNALGQTTTFDQYDAAGRLLRKTGPNGLVTTTTYDPRGRVKTITETPATGAARTTAYTYDAAGKLLTASLPGQGVLAYAYDAAGQLLSVTDTLGNKVSYTYDIKGNRNQEKVQDPNGTLVRQINTAWNARNAPATVNAAGSLTQLVHDAVGNLTQTIDPNGNVTTHQADALDRVIQTVDALGGATVQGYGAGGELASVTAPNAAETVFEVDDLGNVVRETSPDRGITIQSFDPAGNVLTRTDARGITATFTHDALNRVTGIAYPNPGENVSYAYDTCAGGVGRLCGVADATGSRSYSYDGLGRTASSTWTSTGHIYTSTFTWTPGDDLAAVTYPSGRTVSYTRDAIGRVTAITSNGATILTGRTYRADGLVKSQTWANGLTETRTHDLQGRQTAWNVGNVLTRTYAHDANGNITHQDASLYQYDALDRLIWEPGQAIGYDGNGNRLWDGTGNYGYAPASNRMATGPPGAVVHDPAGNTLSIGAKTFAYNQAGRMASTSGTTYTYRHDGLRATKTVNGATTFFHYDVGGRLIAETDAAGATLREYIWDDEAPVAKIATGAITHLHTDHLGTPRLGTNGAGTVVWRWDSGTFGTGQPTGVTTVNLRFPGQYFDAETGLHYNGQRTFDPASGRYLEADPIGLAGGLNSYLYGNASPLRYIDPLGLYVEGFYEQSTGHLFFYDTDSGKMISGTFESGGKPFGDPSPQGKYTILDTRRDDFFRLDPLDSKPYDDYNQTYGRSEIRLHKPGRTTGCVAATDEDNWEKIKNFIRNTKTKKYPVGTSRLKVPLLGIHRGNKADAFTEYGRLYIVP